jgi:hypothetical protein
MPQFVIERHIPGLGSFSKETLRDITCQSNAVVAGLGEPYTWITSYVTGDKMYCIHEAESAETVYRHAREGGFPADSVSEVTGHIGPDFGK